MEKPQKLVLIDSNAIIHRAYHALPPNMANSKGELTNAVYGFTTTLIKVMENIKPDYIAASFDVSKKTFRTEQYTEYKANRVKADQELYDQIPRVRELLNKLNIPIYEKEGYEADDVIGTIVKISQNSNLISQNSGSHSAMPTGRQEAGLSDNNSTIQQFNNLTVYIVTGDKDLFQLIDGNVFVYSLKKGLSQMEIVDRDHIKKEYDLDPTDFIDLKALAGDPSDNIPGVPNIGKVTAVSLLQSFDSLKGIYTSIIRELEKAGLISNFKFLISNQIPNPNDQLKIEQSIENCKLKIEKFEKEIVNVAHKLVIKPRILQLLIIYKDQAFLSQQLATIHREVPIEFNLEKCRFGEYDKDKLKSFFEETENKPSPEQEKKDSQLKLL